MYDVILVGTDGSQAANRAVKHALELGEQYDATVHAISVVDTHRYGEPALSSTELVVNEIEERCNEQLGDIREEAEAMDVAIETRTCHGNPHEEILTYADEIGADLLIVGFQGRTHSEDHIGSVAHKLVNSTDRATMLA